MARILVTGGNGPIAAARALQEFARQSGLELVVLRPPLVYGPGAPGRFALLLRLLRGGWPLPAAGLPAGRSVIFIDNLLDATELALEHPAAAGRCIALCDTTAPATEERGRALATALGQRAA